MQTVRKDNSPEETVTQIRKLLTEKLNISVQESHICDNNKIHSVRLGISNIPLGTNGKGISPTYALASAYGEFMERLQAGFLVEPWIGNYSIEQDDNHIVYNYSEIKDFLSENFTDLKNNFTINDIESFLAIRNNICCCESIYDVFKAETVNLPINVISALCGSNGLCAGNTPYEAICQGIGELFERYVVKEIVSSRFIPYKIKKELYDKLPVYELIKYIEDKGYICNVYDCTLNGKLPVIGVVILNRSKTKKVFALGSDINFDIAIQRCLTEVLQGKILNLTFQSTMSNLINFDILHSDWKKISDNYLGFEMQKHFLKGDGNIPLGFVVNQNFSNSQYLNVFSDTDLAHDKLFVQYLNIIKFMNWKLYIKDYSFLGFPTYRIFIPNSSSLYNDFDQYLNVNFFKASLKKELEKENLQYGKIEQLLCQINDCTDVHSYISLNDVLHILNTKNSKSTHLMEMILLFRRKDYKTLYNKYKIYKNADDSFLTLLLYAIDHGESLNDVIEDLLSFNTNSSIVDFLNACNSIKDTFYTCNNCNTCNETQHCYTPSLILLYKQLMTIKKSYVEDYMFLK